MEDIQFVESRLLELKFERKNRSSNVQVRTKIKINFNDKNNKKAAVNGITELVNTEGDILFYVKLASFFEIKNKSRLVFENEVSTLEDTQIAFMLKPCLNEMSLIIATITGKGLKVPLIIELDMAIDDYIKQVREDDNDSVI